MMTEPAVADLLKKVENRYTLVNAAAKRARMLTSGAQPLAVTKSDKDVTIAIQEIYEGKVSYHKIKPETKMNAPDYTQAKSDWSEPSAF